MAVVCSGLFRSRSQRGGQKGGGRKSRDGAVGGDGRGVGARSRIAHRTVTLDRFGASHTSSPSPRGMSSLAAAFAKPTSAAAPLVPLSKIAAGASLTYLSPRSSSSSSSQSSPSARPSADPRRSALSHPFPPYSQHMKVGSGSDRTRRPPRAGRPRRRRSARRSRTTGRQSRPRTSRARARSPRAPGARA